MARYLKHPKTGEIKTEAEWIEEYADLIAAGKWEEWGGSAFWDAGLIEAFQGQDGDWHEVRTAWKFCKGNVLETFESYEDGLLWAKEHGYLPLGKTASCDHPTALIEYFADVNDLPDGMTDMDIEGNEDKILDYYGLGYEPCLIPEETN